MKSIFSCVIILMLSVAVASGQEFHGRTKHKPVTRMSRTDVRKAQAGVNMYTRENGKVVRNNGVAWTKVFRPKDNVAVKPKTVKQIRRQTERYQRRARR